MDKLLSIPEVAGALSCSESAVKKWIYQRRFPVTKVGSLTRLRACDVEAIAKGGGLPAVGTYPRNTAYRATRVCS
jgi:excisionase family DNA binding protein